RLEPDLPGRADDSRPVGPADPPLSHFRDEWRELALSRVDEIQEESEIGVKTKFPFLPRTAIFKTGVGQFCALRVGQFCALSSRGSDVLHPRPRSECSSCKGTFPRGVGGSSL